MSKWSKGILFEYDEDNQIIKVGVNSKQKTSTSYINNHDDFKGELTLYEILELIVLKARKNSPPEIWQACPRFVAKGAMKEINKIYGIVDREQHGNIKTKNLELLEELKNIIDEFGDKTITAKKIMLSSDKYRLELRARDMTRWQLDSLICQGLLKKVEEGNGDEFDRRENMYQNTTEIRCKYWSVDEKGTLTCNCPKEEWITKTRGKL